jgi:hypothetical protein
MESQRPPEDWYRPSDNRRPREHYQPANRHPGRPFPAPGPEAYQHQARFSGPGQQGRGQDLHASHPYDYSLPPETYRQRDPGGGPAPEYRHRQDHHPVRPNRYEEPAAYQHRPYLDHWYGGPASYEQRQDYIRARDRHAYQQQHGGHQNRYQPQDRRAFRPDNSFTPDYPDLRREGYAWEDRTGNRNGGYNNPANTQQNRSLPQQQRGSSNQYWQEIPSGQEDKKAEYRRSWHKSNYRGDYLNYPDFQGGDW